MPSTDKADKEIASSVYLANKFIMEGGGEMEKASGAGVEHILAFNFK